MPAWLQSDDEVRRYYTRLSAAYDRRTGYEVPHHGDAIRLADLAPGERILVVACGTGRATVELARYVRGGGRRWT